jgi:hypothetical protein
MAKKAKYPAQKLTEEDKTLVGQIFLRYAVKFYVQREISRPKEPGTYDG